MREKKPFAILAERDNEVLACVTGWHEEGAIVSGLMTNPQFLMHESTTDAVVIESLVRALRRESGGGFISVHGWQPIPGFAEHRFWSREANATYVVDLSPPKDELFRRLHESKRRNVRNSEKRGLRFRPAEKRDFASFHELLCVTHERLGIDPPLPVEDLVEPESNRKIFLAFNAEQCVAGTVIRYHEGGLAEYSDNASLPEFWRLRPNDRLLWEGLQWAKSVGCTAFNLGGHNALKKGFGGELKPIHKMSFDPSLFRWRHGREYVYRMARRAYRAARPSG